MALPPIYPRKRAISEEICKDMLLEHNNMCVGGGGASSSLSRKLSDYNEVRISSPSFSHIGGKQLNWHETSPKVNKSKKVSSSSPKRKYLRFSDRVTVIVIPMDKASVHSRKSQHALITRLSEPNDAFELMFQACWLFAEE
jgi:hypothetical protein